MSMYSSNFSTGLGGNYYALVVAPSSYAVGAAGAYPTNFSNSFGAYTADLTNSPVISEMAGYAQLPADWAAITGVTQILNKPPLSVVSATGSYVDLEDLPTISTTGHTGLYSDLIGQPVISTVGHSRDYSDIIGTPVISVVGHSGLY